MRREAGNAHNFLGAPARAPQPRRVWSSVRLWVFLAVMMASCRSVPEKRYPLQAGVVSVDAPRRLIMVKHGEIPGLMPGMTMSYAVNNSKEIAPLRPGDKISAELVGAGHQGHLEKMALLAKAADSRPPS
jgi:Cu/Ag efflux protein CusF